MAFSYRMMTEWCFSYVHVEIVLIVYEDVMQALPRCEILTRLEHIRHAGGDQLVRDRAELRPLVSVRHENESYPTVERVERNRAGRK